MNNFYMPQFGDAVSALRPGAEFVLNTTGNDYKLTWLDKNTTPPTREEVETKLEELINEHPMRLLRIERDRLIAETDWWVLPDRTPTQAQLDYRQALRDLPDTSSPVLDGTNRIGISGVSWPTKP